MAKIRNPCGKRFFVKSFYCIFTSCIYVCNNYNVSIIETPAKFIKQIFF